MIPSIVIAAVFTSNTVVLGILLLVLAAIFLTSQSNHPFWKKFYKFVPSLLLCYFVPSLLTTSGLISGEETQLYHIASWYLLPASLVLLTISVDFKGIISLGPKAIIMFLAGTLGVVIGGPIALFIFAQIDPSLTSGTGADALWRGLSTIAGSWIGGSANQTAMFEVFKPSSSLFSAMITLDIFCAEIWLAFLLYGAGISDRIDRLFNADNSSITKLRKKIENYKSSIEKTPSLADITTICAVGFGITAIGYLGANAIAPWITNHAPQLSKLNLDSRFFWLIVIATAGGLAASFTPVRKLEGAGASKIGSLFLYILVATLGLKMNILAIFHNPGYLAIGVVWILIHIITLIVVGKLINAPFFYMAVGSQANIGGAASAPIVASAFDSALAPVGVLLAVLGYAVGTYGAYICAQLMRLIV